MILTRSVLTSAFPSTSALAMNSQQSLFHIIYIICLSTVFYYVFKFKSLCTEGIYSIKAPDPLHDVLDKEEMDEGTDNFSTTKV